MAHKERALCHTAISCHNNTEYPHVRQIICTPSYKILYKVNKLIKSCQTIDTSSRNKMAQLILPSYQISKPSNIFLFWEFRFCLWCSRSYTCQVCEEFQSGIFQLHFFLKFQQQAPNTSPGIVTSRCVNAHLLVRQYNSLSVEYCVLR